MKPIDYKTEAIMIMLTSTDKKGNIDKLIGKATNDKDLTIEERLEALENIKYEVKDISRIALEVAMEEISNLK